MRYIHYPPSAAQDLHRLCEVATQADYMSHVTPELAGPMSVQTHFPIYNSQLGTESSPIPFYSHPQ